MWTCEKCGAQNQDDMPLCCMCRAKPPESVRARVEKASAKSSAKRAKAVEAMDFTTAPESSPADDLFDNSIEESVSLSFDTPAAQPAVATEPVISGELSIDDELDDYWMQPTPPSKPAPEKEPEPEPVKVQPDNSMQMSLF